MAEHALYRFFAADGSLLYVGLTCDPGARWAAHEKGKPWWHAVANVTVERFPSRGAVAAAELAAIRDEKPRHNRAGTSTADADRALANLEALAPTYAAAQTAARMARDELRSMVVAAAAAGVTEAAAARAAKVTRVTVRAWLGKPNVKKV